MLGSSYSLTKFNNENNLYIPTNLGYFMGFHCCPDIPTKYFNESLAYCKVSPHEYSILVAKLKNLCSSFIVLRILWILRWLTRLALFAIIYLVVVNPNSFSSSDFVSNPVYQFSFIIVLKLLLFILSRITINYYRRIMQKGIQEMNEKTYIPRNLYWRIGSECKHIHLVLNYAEFNSSDSLAIKLQKSQA